MKTILRAVLFYSFALYIVSQLFTGLVIRGGIQTVFLGGVSFAGLNLIVKPILKALSFPLILITLGLFSFVINAGILFALTKFMPQISVHAFTIQKLSYKTYVLPQMHVSQLLAYVVLSAIISFIVGFLTWIGKE